MCGQEAGYQPGMTPSTQPSYAGHVAEALWKALEVTPPPLLLNLAPQGEKMTLWQFACKVALAFDLDENHVVPVKSEELKVSAPRPRDTTFDTTYQETLGIRFPSVDVGILAMKGERDAA